MQKRWWIWVGLVLSFVALLILWIWVWSLSVDTRINVASVSNTNIETNTNWSISDLREVDAELLISPHNTESRFIDFLSNSNDFVYIQTYDFTNNRIRNILKDLADRWTDIRIMQENRKYVQYTDTYRQNINFFSWTENVQMKSDDHLWTNFLHSKLTLSSNKYIISTANLTLSAFRNREFFLIGDDPDIWKNLHHIFLKDWNGETISIDEIHPNILVCPINCRTAVEMLLNSAEKSIKIHTQYIVDRSVIDILKSRDDVDIKIVVADVGSNDDILNYFWPGIARYLSKPYVHTKSLLIDDKYLMIWSINMSDNSMDRNREIWIIITNRETIDNYKSQFDEDWGNGKGRWR